jgi:hypothetical protein
VIHQPACPQHEDEHDRRLDHLDDEGLVDVAPIEWIPQPLEQAGERPAAPLLSQRHSHQGASGRSRCDRITRRDGETTTLRVYIGPTRMRTAFRASGW